MNSQVVQQPFHKSTWNCTSEEKEAADSGSVVWFDGKFRCRVIEAGDRLCIDAYRLWALSSAMMAAPLAMSGPVRVAPDKVKAV
jgi:hypothetical protein